MVDDLDDFFNDIEEAEAEVDDVSDNKNKEGNGDGDVDEKKKKKSEDDDDGAEKEVKDQDQAVVSVELPPAKRIKTEAAAAAAPTAYVRPRGAVVAASAASKKVQQKQQSSSTDVSLPPPPPPPMNNNNNNNYNHPSHQQQQHPMMADAYFGPNSNASSGSNNISTNLPPLPSGPIPMPMPPLPPGPMPPPSQTQQSQQNNNSTNMNKPVVRMAAGKSWVDSTLSEWPANDFRLFVGNLGADVSDEALFQHFSSKYSSVAMSKIVRDAKKNKESKGYGFVSFLQPLDCAKAMREQDQTWLGSRPIRVKRSDWQDRNRNTVQKKQKKENKKQQRWNNGRSGR
jgi:hypothetical protein